MQLDPGSSIDAGQVIGGQFRLERRLGAGGMGEVYLAEQLEMGRWVVVKTMHAHLLQQDPSFRVRFAREARAVACLNHPNVVQIYACGESEQGIPYLVMEYVEGISLKDESERVGAMPEARVLAIGAQICSALEEAHGLGMVHRDLKPENVMLTRRQARDDFVKVLDFGIAKVPAESGARLTQTGVAFGTPQYMSPEQARGQDVDARTDLYALGLILYELLTGEVAMNGATPFEVLMKQVAERPRAFSERGVPLSRATEVAVMRCLEKELALRVQSAAELAHLLRLSEGWEEGARRSLSSVHTEMIEASPRAPAATGPRRVLPKGGGTASPNFGWTPGVEPTARPQQLPRAAEQPNAFPEFPQPQGQQRQNDSYVDYYGRLPLPRALKPFAPWIMSLAMMIVIGLYSMLMQTCNERRMQDALQRAKHATDQPGAR